MKNRSLYLQEWKKTSRWFPFLKIPDVRSVFQRLMVLTEPRSLRLFSSLRPSSHGLNGLRRTIMWAYYPLPHLKLVPYQSFS